MAVLSTGNTSPTCNIYKRNKQGDIEDDTSDQEAYDDSGEYDNLDIDSEMDRLFPNGNVILLALLKAQSKICHDELQGEDHRNRR